LNAKSANLAFATQIATEVQNHLRERAYSKPEAFV
jgi:hypothetical protein